MPVKPLTHVLLCIAMLIWLPSMGQKVPPPKISLDSLSASDKALLELYKDSFNAELQSFLSVFENPRLKKFDTTVYDMDRSSHAEIGVGFASHFYINGRDAGVNGVGFFPSATYLHKTGLYAGAGFAVYTDKAIEKSSPIPSAWLTAGFHRTFFKRWGIGLSYAHTFLTYGGPVLKKLLVNNFSVGTSIDMWKKLIIGANVQVDFSDFNIGLKRLPQFEKRSVEVDLTLRKDFVIYKFIGAKVFTLTPAITAIFATDNFAYIRRTTAEEQKTNGGAKLTATFDRFFGFVDVEPSLTIDWRIRNFEILAMPTLAIPFNTVDNTTRQRVVNPKQYNFYVVAGLKYLFNVKTKKQKAKARL